jgi:hypothetical protein
LYLIAIGLFVCGLKITGALGDEGCPADRPHRRYVQEFPQTITAMACMPQLVCFPGEDVCSYAARSCNQQQPTVRILCLGDAELKAAEGQ